MLKSFYTKNYKNFQQGVKIDFSATGDYSFSKDCLINGLIGKMLIYGRNSSGKTNLGNALMDAEYTLIGNPFADYFYQNDSDAYINADSDNQVAEFTYKLQFGQQEVVYRYTKKSPMVICTEELEIDHNQFYYVDYTTGQLNLDSSTIEINMQLVEQYILEQKQAQIDNGEDSDKEPQAQIPLLRWLCKNVIIPLDSPIVQAFDFLTNMDMYKTQNAVIRSRSSRTMIWKRILSKEEQLKDFEAFLNDMGVPCKLIAEQLPDGRYQLYFTHTRLLPFFETASSGTLALADLYHSIIQHGYRDSLMFFDEFDAYFHYEMAERLVQYMKKRYPEKQIILTTHNTNLMANRLMRPDCLFILSQDGKLTALKDATNRELREGYNLEKMYISGEFKQYE